MDLERRGLGRRGAFVVGSALGAVPRTIERAREVTEAQRARGLDTEGGPWVRVRGLVPLVGPMVFGALAEVEERAMALEARGFSAPGRRTILRALPDSTWQRAARWMLLIGSIAAVVATTADTVRGPVSAGLILAGAGYRYAGASRPSLRDVSLQLSPGRVVGVVGANESGKTTLCLVAAGLAPAAIGGQLRGRSASTAPRRRRCSLIELAQRCGLLFQNPATQLSGTAATVFEEVAFGPSNLGLPAADVVARVDWALASWGSRSSRRATPSDCRAGRPSWSPWRRCWRCGRRT